MRMITMMMRGARKINILFLWFKRALVIRHLTGREDFSTPFIPKSQFSFFFVQIIICQRKTCVNCFFMRQLLVPFLFILFLDWLSLFTTLHCPFLCLASYCSIFMKIMHDNKHYGRKFSVCSYKFLVSD